jgi:hypothetical protein
VIESQFGGLLPQNKKASAPPFPVAAQRICMETRGLDVAIFASHGPLTGLEIMHIAEGQA